jgi:hypothetical protein
MQLKQKATATTIRGGEGIFSKHTGRSVWGMTVTLSTTMASGEGTGHAEDPSSPCAGAAEAGGE